MESTGSEDLTIVTSEDNQEAEPEKPRVSAADMQRAHTRVAARLGDVVCEGWDTVAVELESEY